MGFWKNEGKFYEVAYRDVDNFFENLYNNEENDDLCGLKYREGQHSYALDIMEAIKNKEILLIQAGVGIGKSFGYLLPVFNAFNNVNNFNKVIISTSSIALQEQLLNDIKVISDMLDIDIKADIAKGVINYACLKRIYHHINSYLSSPQNKEILEELAIQIEMNGSSDRADLMDISENVWKSIQLQSRGFCSKCTYSRLCPFYKKQQELGNNNIIITNHANMVKNIIDNTDMITDMDMIIFDEAHKLEENMRNVQLNELRLNNIFYQINQVVSILGQSYSNGIVSSFDEDDYSFVNALHNDISNLFSSIRTSASRNFSYMKKKNNNEEDYSITDYNRLPFKITNDVLNNLNKVLNGLDILLKEVDLYENRTGIKIKIKELEYLKNARAIFLDMKLNEESNNIYWTDFYKENKISLWYVSKSIFDVSKKIFSAEIPIVCTSGTILDNNNGYHHFMEGLELTKLTKRTIAYGDEQVSPYNYDENSLFYYNPNLSSPKEGDSYVEDLAIEINELIRATNGKALILFTSKVTMNRVYDLLKSEEFPFEILLHTDNNANEIKEHFANDVDSCLFATGVFWEGIDIKGKSLSNLIITHLPFEQVDAINQYKASMFDKRKQFKEVYFPNMLVKLKQAIGRLIRSDEDTGIVCCLDSRFDNYKNNIISGIPMTRYTTDKRKLYEFIDEKILDKPLSNGIKRIKKIDEEE